MTVLPPSPFIAVDVRSAEPTDNRFVLDVDAFMAAIEPAPAFITDPSPDFIAAMHRDVLPVLEDAVRRAY